jgi:hypothetical protein
MVLPEAERMNEAQRSTVEAALNTALTTGKRFESTDAIDEYLKDFVSENIRHSFPRDIYDSYLRLVARQGPLLSPPFSDSSHSNTFETNLDIEDGSEKSDTIAVEFLSEVSPS